METGAMSHLPSAARTNEAGGDTIEGVARETSVSTRPGSPSREIKLFGTDEPAAESRVLRAGPLSAELDAGQLRYIRFAGREAIRAIAYIVRDPTWGTYNPEISNLVVEESPERFRVRYRALCRDERQSIEYRTTITGSADGRLLFEADATPEADFHTNRTGFAILHPLEGVTGRPVTVRRVDGSVDQTEFPVLINPAQPIAEIRSLTHEIMPGVRVECTMIGDTFEMEDQRNWTDASYKTYVRPLALPHPYTLPAGETLRQSVELSFEGAAPAVPAQAEPPPTTVRLGTASGSLPAFGMALEPQHGAAALGRQDALACLRPAFVSLYLDSRQSDATSALRDAATLAAALGAELSLEVVVPGEPDGYAGFLGDIAKLTAETGAHVSSVAVSPAGDLVFIPPGTVFPDTREFDAIFAAARAAFPAARIGGGNFVYFTELNRKPPPATRIEFVCHSTSALAHAADERSVTESLESLPYVIRSCRHLFPDGEYRLGPGSIGSRVNPFGSASNPNPDANRITMVRADPRQRGLLGAAWHLGYAARAAEAGVESVILAAPVGEFGLIHHPDDYRQPWFDEAGGLFPVYHVMRGVYAASGAERIPVETSDPRNLQVLAFRRERGPEVWMANLSGEERTVTIEGIDTGGMSVATLDEASFESCTARIDGFDNTERPLGGGDTLRLAPYAVLRLRTAR